MQPDISIIIPIYNVEKYLEQCLESVCGQTLDSLQIVCVDDGSTDASGPIVDAFAARDARIVAIHKENEGYGKGVNVGLDAAVGRYIGIVEPDDYLDPSMFEKLFARARKTDADIVKAAYWRVCDADTPQETILPANYLHCVSDTHGVFRLKDDAEFLFHHPSIWTAIYRKDFLDEHGIRMHEIPGAGWADNPWLMETLAQAESISYIDECLYYYREFNLGSSSVVKDPAIIYQRWIDMDDIAQTLGIADYKTLEGHNNRGCAYLEMLENDFDIAQEPVKSGVKEMLRRMDGALVAQSGKIPEFYKDAYFKAASKPKWMMRRIKRKCAHMLRRS